MTWRNKPQRVVSQLVQPVVILGLRRQQGQVDPVKSLEAEQQY